MLAVQDFIEFDIVGIIEVFHGYLSFRAERIGALALCRRSARFYPT
jgi:hypothetical protein